MPVPGGHDDPAAFKALVQGARSKGILFPADRVHEVFEGINPRLDLLPVRVLEIYALIGLVWHYGGEEIHKDFGAHAQLGKVVWEGKGKGSSAG